MLTAASLAFVFFFLWLWVTPTSGCAVAVASCLCFAAAGGCAGLVVLSRVRFLPMVEEGGGWRLLLQAFKPAWILWCGGGSVGTHRPCGARWRQPREGGGACMHVYVDAWVVSVVVGWAS